MIQVWLIDEQGFFTGESKFVSEEELTDLTITKPILTGYIKTKWNVLDWEEGATEEEIQAWKDANTPQELPTNKIDISLEEVTAEMTMIMAQMQLDQQQSTAEITTIMAMMMGGM